MNRFLIAVLFISGFFSGISSWALELTGVVKSYKNSIADVAFTLQYDKKGEVPSTVGIYCGACSAFHDSNLSSLLANHQDLLVTGYIVKSDELLIPAMLIEAAGVKDINVIFNGKRIPAKVTAIYPDQGALKLKTAKPLAGAVPLTFAPYKKGEKLFSYSRIRELGHWMSRIRNFSPDGSEVLMENNRLSKDVPGNSLILNAQGKAVALMLNNNEALDHISWHLNYTQWHAIDIEKYFSMQQNLEKHLKKALLPVTVYTKEWKLSRREKIMNIVPERELNSFAFMLPGNIFFMPMLTTPQQHTLIEKVVVHTSKGDVECRIAGVMKKFGGMVLMPKGKVKLDIPLVSPHIAPLSGKLGEIVWSTEIGIYPKELKITVFSDILVAAVRGFHNTVGGSTLKKGVPDLLFDLNGDLLGINVSVRAFNYNRLTPFTDIVTIAKMLTDPRELVPFQAMCNPPEAVGFLGVEYQILNQELVRSLNLEHLTSGGREGLLISYVYPGSPAEKIGLKAGDILLKIIVPDGGAPIRLTGKNFALAQERQFPWKNLDGIPEVYFSEIPEPWKGVKNPLARQLANIGIGEKITLIAIMQGKVVSKELTVANAPTYFEIAPAYRSGALGLEVKNMTFEVRRYFRMADNASGVIVSEVFAGRPASVAGLRPFEIITAVDDQVIHNVEDFKKAVAGKSEVRLSVRRLAANRVVTVKAAVGPRR